MHYEKARAYFCLPVNSKGNRSKYIMKQDSNTTNDMC